MLNYSTASLHIMNIRFYHKLYLTRIVNCAGMFAPHPPGSCSKTISLQNQQNAEEHAVNQCKSSNVGCESQAAAAILVCFTTCDGHARSPSPEHLFGCFPPEKSRMCCPNSLFSCNFVGKSRQCFFS